jgi:uncharacterized damage-inducible protein DinB
MEDALLKQIRKSFEYDYWANDQYIKAILEMPQPPEKAVKIFAHILFALDVWLARLTKEDLFRYTDPNPSTSLAEGREKLDDLHQKWKSYLASLTPEELTGKFSAPNTQGKLSEHMVQNVLFQVITHSHYHRGQLASLVHQGGGKRPGTDYIAYTYAIGESKFV